jgi:hypothetical protein
MTTHFDDKLPISGDAAETIAAYLEELNFKLLMARVDGAYAIVAETENLILDKMKSLGKSTKATVDDVLEVLKIQGSPDHIVKQHTKMSNIDYYEESKSTPIEPSSRKLPQRQGAIPMGMIEIIIKVFLARLYLFLPILFISLALYNLLDNQSFPFLIASGVLFLTHEIYTGISGNLVEEYSITLHVRRLYRALLFTGTFLTFSVSRVSRHLKADYNYYDHNYLDNHLEVWLILFFMIEFAVLIRDHVANFHPLEPEFQPFIRFFTLPYLVLTFSLVLLLFPFNPISPNFKMQTYLILSISATLVTVIVKFRQSLRFYLTALSVTLVPRIVYGIGEIEYEPRELNRSNYYIYLTAQIIALLLILYKRYKQLIRKELSEYSSKIGNAYESY